MSRAEFAFKGDLHCISLACIGNSIDDCLTLHDLADAHGDSLFGHIFKSREPAFAELLFAADFVKIHNKIGCFGIEISRGIVEREVTVFTDTDKSHVDRIGGDIFLKFSENSITPTPRNSIR